MNICVVIPVYNESANIAQLVASLKAKDLDVVVIDDGSTDNSGDLAKEKGATVIHQDHRHGKGFSLKQGFAYCLEHDYDGVITMDGDGQHDTADIDQFVQCAIDKQADIVNGNRMAKTKSMPLIRYWTNRFMSGLISAACKQSIPDTQCGYRYVRCDVLKAITLECDEFEIETEILMKACKKGFKVASVSIQTIYGGEESSIRPVKDTIRFFKYFIRELKNK